MSMDLDETKRIIAAATEGPWEVIPGENSDRDGIRVPGGAMLTWDDHGGEVLLPDDAAFIAHARTALPELVAEVERLRAGMAWRSVYDKSVTDHATRHAEAAEADQKATALENADLLREHLRLEATIERVQVLVEEWEAIGPGTPFENAMGQQSVTIETAARLIRAALESR